MWLTACWNREFLYRTTLAVCVFVSVRKVDHLKCVKINSPLSVDGNYICSLWGCWYGQVGGSGWGAWTVLIVVHESLFWLLISTAGPVCVCVCSRGVKLNGAIWLQVTPRVPLPGYSIWSIMEGWYWGTPSSAPPPPWSRFLPSVPPLRLPPGVWLNGLGWQGLNGLGWQGVVSYLSLNASL